MHTLISIHWKSFSIYLRIQTETFKVIADANSAKYVCVGSWNTQKKRREKKTWLRYSMPLPCQLPSHWFTLPFKFFFCFPGFSRDLRAFTSACLATFAVFTPTSHIFLCRLLALHLLLLWFVFYLFYCCCPAMRISIFNTGACVCWKNKYQSYAPAAEP